jgi:crotonobetainyl-CoA:carnitine CoA-transferase CaiB-like acyl-CoA transferase
MTSLQRSKALARFKVIDLTRVRSGPTCVRQFADWGADVIMVEMPESLTADSGGMGAREGPDFQNLHRNKKSMTLDLKKPAGKEVFMRLVKDADVIVENYRPDVKTRLGIDYESIRKINPRIVYTSISGFGQDGPYVERPGVDQIAQGMSGLMSITGEPGRGPMRVGIAIADVTAGMFAALGTMAALLERESSGEGQWVHTSLLEANIFILDFQAARWTMAKEIAEQAGNNHPTGITGAFKTKDGAINLAPPPFLWERFVKALGSDELKNNPEFQKPKERVKNRARVNAVIEEITRTKTSAEWVAYFNEQGIPCGPIYTIDQTFADEQVKHLGIAQTVESPKLGPITLIGQPVHLSRTPSAIASAPPERGEHTASVLASLGYSAREIEELKKQGVV